MPPNNDDDDDLPRDYRDYPDGSLLRVVFHDFLTYQHTSFLPTAHLNMILGHNGSGKSSIICGICLACGGTPKSLGRSEKIIEYVRHGCTEGYVEIAIADAQKGPQIVRLTIRVGHAPEYRLNNEVTKQQELVKLRKHYNIQIDNPCAFLAQDKVKSFSEQSSIELLKNTEKAASEDLSIQHDELITQRTDSSTIEEKCTTSEKNLKHLDAEIQKLQPFVENYRKKLALQTKLRLLEKKKKVLEYEEAVKTYNEELKVVDETMGDYNEVEAAIKKCEAKKKGFDKRLNEEKTYIRNLSISGQELLSKIDNTMDKKKLVNITERARQKLVSTKAAFERHEKEVVQVKKAMETARAKLEDAESDVLGYEAFCETLRKAEKQFGSTEREIRAEEDAIQKKTYNLKGLENKQRDQEKEAKSTWTDRFRALESYNGDAGKAYRYYQQNKADFRGDVYVPIMDMILKYPESSKALENSVGMRDRAMFVCRFKEDERRINGEQHSWHISTAVVTNEQLRREDIEGTLPDELRRMGFKFLVSECFDAPAPLKQYLCNVGGLSKIPFGGDEVEKRLVEVSENLVRAGYQVFLTNQLRCQSQMSRYSGEVIQSQSPMRDAFTWKERCFKMSPYATTNANDDDTLRQIEEFKAEIKNRADALREKRFDLQRERDALRTEQIQWKSKRQVENKWRMELQQESEKLKRVEKETVNVAKAEREFQEASGIARKETKTMLEAVKKYQKEYINVLKELARRANTENIVKQHQGAAILEADEHRSKLVDLEDLKRNAELQLRNTLRAKQAASEALQKECSLKHLDTEKMSSKEKEILAKLNKLFADGGVPGDLRTLENDIVMEKTRLKLTEDSGEDGSIEHEQAQERKKEELVEEQNKHDKLVESRQRLHTQLNTDIGKWREEVEEMIERINANYVKYFGVLGCRGEVSLEVPENALDIEKYGIMIMVCFRAGEKMKRLDNKVQSGGERSVATMLYLLALQQLCPVPFRCIDEINQGMDPTNERKVFDIMVGLWNGNEGALTKTQYFLLSPKLLHGLDMRENVNIVMVNSTLVDYHGKKFDTQSKLDATLAQLQINA